MPEPPEERTCRDRYSVRNGQSPRGVERARPSRPESAPRPQQLERVKKEERKYPSIDDSQQGEACSGDRDHRQSSGDLTKAKESTYSSQQLYVTRAYRSEEVKHQGYTERHCRSL